MHEYAVGGEVSVITFSMIRKYRDAAVTRMEKIRNGEWEEAFYLRCVCVCALVQGCRNFLPSANLTG